MRNGGEIFQQSRRWSRRGWWLTETWWLAIRRWSIKKLEISFEWSSLVIRQRPMSPWISSWTRLRKLARSLSFMISYKLASSTGWSKSTISSVRGWINSFLNTKCFPVVKQRKFEKSFHFIHLFHSFHLFVYLILWKRDFVGFSIIHNPSPSSLYASRSSRTNYFHFARKNAAINFRLDH